MNNSFSLLSVDDEGTEDVSVLVCKVLEKAKVTQPSSSSKVIEKAKVTQPSSSPKIQKGKKQGGFGRKTNGGNANLLGYAYENGGGRGRGSGNDSDKEPITLAEYEALKGIKPRSALKEEEHPIKVKSDTYKIKKKKDPRMSLKEFHESLTQNTSPTEHETSDNSGQGGGNLMGVEPGIKDWARLPKHLKPNARQILPRSCWKLKNNIWVLDASLCVAMSDKYHPEAELLGWEPPEDKPGNFQIQTDGQYTENKQGVVVKTGFGVDIKAVDGKIQAYTHGPSTKEKGSEVHEYLALKMGVILAAECKKDLGIKTLELASDNSELIKALKKMKDEDNAVRPSVTDSRRTVILREIRELIIEHFDGMHNVIFCLFPREIMQIADLLGRIETDDRVTRVLGDEGFYQQWILYFEERDIRSNQNLRLKQRGIYADNHYIRFYMTRTSRYDFVREKVRFFEQPGMYGNPTKSKVVC